MKKSLMDVAAQQDAPTDGTDSAAAADAGNAPAAPDTGSTGGTFKKPDISQFVPPEVKDAVDRVAAAGMRMMYAPEMRQELQQAIASKDPMPKTLATNVVGLLLTLDQKAPGGIPQAALFPAGMELLGEACDVMTAAGRDVSQTDYNDAALMMYAMIGKKLGGSNEDLMGAAAQSLQGGNPNPGPDAGTTPPGAQPTPPAGMPPGAAAQPGQPPVA